MDRLTLASRIAKIAGERVKKKHFNKTPSIQFKADDSVVSKADHYSNDILIKAIKRYFPQDGIISEESRGNKSRSEFAWIIDPIDGTTNFLMGLESWGVSVGITRKGELWAGAIYFPVQKILLTAQDGEGAFINGKRFAARERKKPIVACIVKSRDRTIESDVVNAYRKLNHKRITPRDLGSATFVLELIARGKVDFGIFFKSKPWDIAAGFVIAKESGAAIKRLDSGKNPLVGNFIIATGPRMLKIAERILLQ